MITLNWKAVKVAALFVVALGSTAMMAADPSIYFHDAKVASLARAGADGNAALIRALVTQGVSPNARGDGGVTPLLWAVASLNVTGVRVLLAEGGDPTQGDDRGINALALAARSPRPEILKAMLDTGRVNVNAPVDRGDTMLMLAARHHLMPQIRLLLAAGADPNVRDSVGGTALNESFGKFDISLILLEAGANPLYPVGRTCFSQDVASEASRLDIMPADTKADYEKVVDWLQAHHEARPAPPPI